MLISEFELTLILKKFAATPWPQQQRDNELTTDHHDADGDDDEGADEGHYGDFFNNNSTLV
jgi:hypothetical protein